MEVAVIGCGRVGLPLALALARRGHQVWGVETDAGRRREIENGTYPFRDPDGARELRAGAGLRVVPGVDPVLERCRAFVIAVGTPLNARGLPVMQGVLGLFKTIVTARPEALVMVRSTLSPGTSGRLQAWARRELGLEPGRGYYYAVCPERSLEGHTLSELAHLPQLVGTFEPASAAVAREVLAPLGAPLIFTDPLEAELAKLFNNAYRYVNFALGNECLMIAEELGADVHRVLQVAREGYERGAPWPSGYAAGPCLVKDAGFLSDLFPLPDLLVVSNRINQGLGEFLLRRAEAIRPLRCPAVLGLAFKAESDDTRESLGLHMCALLEQRGLDPLVHDPYVTSVPGIALVEVLRRATELFVMVPHRCYTELSLTELTRLCPPGTIAADPWGIWGLGRAVARLGG